jgi:hypothetical protein
MAFLLAGSVVIQSGTDTNLSGLSAIAGVVTTSIIGGLVRYEMGALRLVVNGTLTIGGSSAPLEILIIGQDAGSSAAPDIDVYGTLVIGQQYTSDGVSDSINPGIKIYEPGVNKGFPESSGFTDNTAFLRVNSGGSFLWYSGTVDTWGGWRFSTGSIVQIGFSSMTQKPILDMTRATRVGSGVATQIVYCFASISMYGLRLLGGRNSLNTADKSGGVWAQLAAPTTFIGYDAKFVATAFGGSSLLPASTTLSFRNVGSVNPRPIFSDGGLYTTTIFQFINYELGSDFTTIVGSGPRSATVTCLKEFIIYAKKLSGVAISSSVFYLVGKSGTQFTSTVSGVGATNTLSFTLRTLVYNNTATGGSPTSDVYFSKNNNNTDLIDVFGFDYYHQTSQTPGVSLKGIGVLNQNQSFFDDENVTLTESLAGALSTVSTLDELYDSGKYWKTRNITANLEYPSLVSQPITAAGDTLNLGAMNLVVDMTAAHAFSIDTGTDTIIINSNVLSPGIKFNKLITTGEVAFVNGSTSDPLLSYQDLLGLRVPIKVLNIYPNTRVQLYNVSTATEIYNDVISTATLSLTEIWSSDQIIRYRAMYVNGTSAKQWVEANATLTSSGLTITLNQVDDLIYSSSGIDGSTVSECTIVGTSLVISINDPDNKTTAQRLLAFEIYWLYTVGGIRDQNLYIEYTDATHLIFLGGLKVKNSNLTTPLSISGASIVPDVGDPANVIDATGGSININTSTVVIIGGDLARQTSLDQVSKNTNLIPLLL